MKWTPFFIGKKKQSILLETGKGSRSEMKITQNQVQAAVDCPVACLVNVP